MDALTILTTVWTYVRYLIVAYTCTILLFPVVSVYQERRIWNPSPSLPSLSIFGNIKVYVFNVIWMGFTFIGCTLLMPKWILGGFGRSVERDAHTLVERMTAIFCISTMVGPVVVRGLENLPPDVTEQGKPAPIYVANHASQIDVGAVYYLFRRFKWIAKKSVLYLPGVGQVMFLANHIFIDRRTGKNKNSVSTLYAKSDAAVQGGTAMFIFPQGTRRIAERLPFKDGAFNIAIKNKSPLVPVSVEIPMSAWNSWYPLCLCWGGRVDPVVLTVHKMIEVSGTEEKEELKKRCADVIYSVLPLIGEENGTDGKAETKKKQS